MISRTNNEEERQDSIRETFMESEWNGEKKMNEKDSKRWGMKLIAQIFMSLIFLHLMRSKSRSSISFQTLLRTKSVERKSLSFL